MSFSVSRHDDAVVIGVDGQLVVGNRHELKQLVFDELERGARHFRIDFRRTDYVDSSGLGALISLGRAVRDRQGDVKLANLNDDLKQLFQLARLDALFPLEEGGGDDGLAGRPAPRQPPPRGSLSGAVDDERLPPDEGPRA